MKEDTMTIEMPHVAGVTHRYVEGFHVAECGGPSEPVVLLHGFPQHWYAWRHVMTRLAGEHRVIALDMRGSGWSDAPRHGYDTRSLVADVLAVLDALGMHRVSLIGHQWGGVLGFQLCLADPERFSRFVAVNALHPWPQQRRLVPQLWRYWTTALFEYPWVGAWVLRTRPGVLRWLLRRGIARTPDELAAYVDVAREPARARAGQQLHWQFVLHDIPRLVRGRDRRRRLTVPTVLLAGEGDFALSPRSLPGGERYADDLQVQVVPGGHYLPEERPDVVAEALA
jgi:pimeloyl-ACP methyl ester carboxylesterase